jgi:hypothetical protein
MKGGVAIAVMVFVGLAAAASGEAREPQPSTVFTTAHRGIYCSYTLERWGGATLRCDILGGLSPQPGRRSCSVGPPFAPNPWQGLSMTRKGRVRPVCSAQSIRDNVGGPGICAVTAVGPCAELVQADWAEIGFRCTVTEGDFWTQEAIWCVNGRRHSFFLSPGYWSVD